MAEAVGLMPEDFDISLALAGASLNKMCNKQSAADRRVNYIGWQSGSRYEAVSRSRCLCSFHLHQLMLMPCRTNSSIYVRWSLLSLIFLMAQNN